MSGHTSTAATTDSARTFQPCPAISAAAVPALLTLLRNTDAEIAACAAEQLAGLGAQAVPALVAALGGRGLRGAGQALVAALLPAQAQAAQLYRQRVEALLLGLGPECVPALAAALGARPGAAARAVLERALARHGVAVAGLALLAPSAL